MTSTLKLLLKAYTETIVLCLSVLFLPLIVNTARGAFGYEIPKVYGLYFVIVILFVTFSIRSIVLREINKKRFFNSLKHTILPAAVILISSYFSIVGIEGSQFREQGYLFWISLLILFVLVSSTKLKSINNTILIYSLLISTIFQILIGLLQVIKGLEPSGSFGQTNFYADFLLLGYFIIANFTISIKSRTKKAFGAILLTLYILMIFLSGSYLAFILALLIPFALKFKTALTKTSVIIPIVLFSIFLIYLFLATNNDYTFRLELWLEAINYQFLTLPTNGEYVSFLIGSGPDSIYYIYDSIISINEVVDRSHNLILDLLLSFGIAGVCLFIYFSSIFIVKIRNIDLSAEQRFLVSIIVIQFLVAQVHTLSVVWFFITTLCLGLLYRDFTVKSWTKSLAVTK